MKTKKIVIFLLLVMLLGAVLTVTASADVISEPNNEFYYEHSDECTYNNSRRYTVNSEEGYVDMYAAPDSKKVLSSYANGDTVVILYTYTAADGEVWGIYDVRRSGWIRMAELSRIYDSELFINEHSAKITENTAGANGLTASVESPVRVWRYPGGDMISSYNIRETAILENIISLYEDDDGRLWGYIRYSFGVRDIWVCISEPYSEEAGGYLLTEKKVVLKAEPVIKENHVTNVDPELEPPIDDGILSPEETDKKVFIIAGALVAAVVAVTLTLIIVIFRKKSKPLE